MFIGKPRDYSRSGKTLYHCYAGQKRTSLMMIGASVVWGDGLDQMDQYTSKMQRAINSYVGASIANNAARTLHCDDLQEGGPVSGGTPSYIPYNANNEISGYGAGLDTAGSTAYCSLATQNPLISPYDNTSASIGRSKLNCSPYPGGTPTASDSYIFGGSTYGGDKSPSSWRDGTILLNATGQNIRFGVNVPHTGGYLLLKVFGTGSLNIYGAGGYVGTNFTSWPTFNPYAVSVSAGTTTPQLLVIPLTTDTGVVQPQGMQISWASGSVYIMAMYVTAATSASNHIIVQTCARNSYCLDDFAQSSVLDAVMKSVIQDPNLDSNSSSPIYVVGDSYNSIVTPSRLLLPSAYANKLEYIGNYLSNASNYAPGSIILTMPIRAQSPSFVLSGGSWVGSGMRNASSGSVQWQDYWEVIYNLAAAKGWGFVDQSALPTTSGTQSDGYTGGAYPGTMPSNFYQCDGLHPTPTGTTSIANAYISQLGLSGGV